MGCYFLFFRLRPTDAAFLNIQVNGAGTSDYVLLGVNNLLVGSTTYNVLFINGSCDSMFSGCGDSATDFDLQTSGDASAASIGLLGAIEALDGDFFDTNMDQIFGLANPLLNDIFIPYAFTATNQFKYRGFTLTAPSSGYPNSTSPFDRYLETFENSRIFEVYADFTVVPVPAPAAISHLLSGLVGLGLMARRKQKRNAA